MRTKPILHHDTVFIMIMMTLICPLIPQASGTHKKKYACFKIIAINCSSDMECTSDADRKMTLNKQLILEKKYNKTK